MNAQLFSLLHFFAQDSKNEIQKMSGGLKIMPDLNLYSYLYSLEITDIQLNLSCQL